MAVLAMQQGSDDAGAPARDGVAQVRRLGGGDEMPLVDAKAEGFVAAVFPDHAVGKLVCNEQCESVR